MTQVIEGVAFNRGIYYDALHYYTNGAMIKKSVGGKKWFILTKQRPQKVVFFRIRPKTKRMNPYTFFGIQTDFPKAGTAHQHPVAGDVTDIQHVTVEWNTRYNEWNEGFNFDRVST